MDRQKRWRAGRRAAVAAAVVALLFVAAAAVPPRIALPLPISERLVSLVTEAWGVPFAADRAVWAGRSRITFHGVTVYAPEERAAARGAISADGASADSAAAAGPVAMTVDRAEVDVSWADVLPWAEPAPERVIVVRGVQWHLSPDPTRPGDDEPAGDAGDAGGGFPEALERLAGGEGPMDLEGIAAAVEGLRPWLGDELPTVEEARVRLGDGYVVVEGARLQSARGTAEVDVRVEGEPGEGEAPAWNVQWHVRTDGWQWDGPPWNAVPYDIRRGSARGVWHPGGAVTLEHLAADLVAGGRTRRVEAAGTVDADGTIAFDVTAADVQLPDDLPLLARWSVAGTAHFDGAVKGRGHDLHLEGTATMGPGTLWGQSVDFARADIVLTPQQLTVDRSEIRQGRSRYEVAGTWQFPAADSPPLEAAAADPVPTGPVPLGGDDPYRRHGALDLALRTEEGRAETLLEVLGWSTWPLTGKVDGVLRFRGPVGSLESEGQLTVTEGKGWNQPFDEIAAAYRWDREALILSDGLFRLRGGRGEFHGRIGADGTLDVAIDSTGFPLEALEAVRAAGLDTLTGRIGFQGRVQGTLADPQWEGRMHGTALAMGGLSFERGGGELAQSRGIWEVRSLVLERASGARYTVSGWLDASPEEAPLVHLLVEVDGERLEEALALMGVRLAYPLASGRVEGRSLLVGELSRPDGEVVLDVTDAVLAGRPTGLSVELDVAGGHVKVRHLRLGEGEPDQDRARRQG